VAQEDKNHRNNFYVTGVWIGAGPS